MQFPPSPFFKPLRKDCAKVYNLLDKTTNKEFTTMKELKHTLDLENYIINDLKSDEDIKLYLNASLKDYLEDGDFNSFYRSLEFVIKSKDIVA